MANGAQQEHGGRWHVVPLGDTQEHEASASCWCEPVEDDEEPGLWLHNSTDEREAFEQGTRKPS